MWQSRTDLIEIFAPLMICAIAVRAFADEPTSPVSKISEGTSLHDLDSVFADEGARPAPGETSPLDNSPTSNRGGLFCPGDSNSNQNSPTRRETDRSSYELAAIQRSVGDVAQPDLIQVIDPRSLSKIFENVHRTSDSKPLFKFRGRIEEDFLDVNQSAANRATFGNLPDTIGLRRARIGTEGNFTHDSRYVTEIDLSSGTVVLRDTYLAFGLAEVKGEYKFGHMREPFSLEGATSSNTFAFLERSPINSLDPARNWGAGFTRISPSKDQTFAMGLFQAGTDTSDLQFGPGSTTSLTAKWTMRPWSENDGERLMHLGLAVSERFADQGLFIIKQRPSSPLLDLSDSSESPFLPTLKISGNFQQLINAQWALVNGPAWAQAEWYGSIIDQRDGRPLFFHGSHLDAGYFLTGEHRSYVPETSSFGPVSVHRPVTTGFSSKQHPEILGHGALELTARLSYLDFLSAENLSGPPGQQSGTSLPQAAIGMNWYLADRLRLMFNYVYTVPYETSSGASNASLFASRIALYW